MTGVLLDTIGLDYLIRSPASLPKAASSVLFGEQSDVFVSVVSFWELSIHVAQGRIIFDVPFAETMEEIVTRYSLTMLPVTLADVARNAAMPFLVINGAEHRDPFDRLLIAQALNRSLPIVTKDRKFPGYGMKTIW